MHVTRKTLSLLLIAVALTAYTVPVHRLAARHLSEDPASAVVYWTSGPSGSLFPWPTAPGLLEVITQANDVDVFIYRYLLKTQALTGLALLLWVMTGRGVFRKKDVRSPKTLSRQGGTDEATTGSAPVERLKASTVTVRKDLGTAATLPRDNATDLPEKEGGTAG